jgi:NAD(P)-dependent dehydrogenase (short-subunit alcohol dehydrogenase family)
MFIAYFPDPVIAVHVEDQDYIRILYMRPRDGAMRRLTVSGKCLQGQVVIVTGAGGGLGRSYALSCAANGAAVVVNDIETEPGSGGSAAADSVVAEIVAAGGSAAACGASVASVDGADAILTCALDNFGTVDAVVHNAGVLRNDPLERISLDDIDFHLRVHVHGALYLTSAAFTLMKAKEYGRFVFASSSSGVFGNPAQAAYGASKSALVGFSNVVALEGREHNIFSNCILPHAPTRLVEEDPAFTELLAHLTETGATREVVAPLVAYLASSLCTVTHESFVARGGRYCRVFTGMTPGWQAGRGVVVSPADVADHIDDIMNTSGFVIPGSLVEEHKALDQFDAAVLKPMTAGAPDDNN